MKGAWLDALLFSVSVAVGITPQMLPVIVTTCLSRGATQMAKQDVIVKTPSAIQNLGAIDILCTDKTGTITADEVILERHLNVLGEEDEYVLRYAFLNSYFQTGLRNLIDSAIINATGQLTDINNLINSYTKADEVPFDFERRRMSVVVEDVTNNTHMITKGAVEEVLAVCTSVNFKTHISPLTNAQRQDILRRVHDLNHEGMRVVAVAQKDNPRPVGEFGIDDETRALIDRYGDLCDDLPTDLHECLGHGSGQLLKETDPDALKAYGNTIEEARADLFGLYYLADDKLVELGLTPDREAYKSQYYTYMQNGLLTQAVRIELGNDIEEAHMRNRALIANWALDMDVEQQIVALEMHGGKHYVSVKDYEGLRGIFARQLGEIQRIKSEGDFNAARALVEKYAVHIDSQLHREILERYEKLGIAPYKGFLNPWMKPEYNENGNIVDIKLDYTESYAHQMMRYSSEY